MKLLLIDPPFKNFTGLFSMFFPLGLSYVAGAAIRAGYECKILDMDAAEPMDGSVDFTKEYESFNHYVKALNDPDHPTWKHLKELTAAQKPDVIGITALTTKFGSVIRTAKLAREACPGVPILIGGPHASAMPELTASIPEVDYVLRGEGDESIVELLNAIRDGKDPSAIKGLTYKKEGKIISTPDRALIADLDSIAFPAREALLNPESYSTEDMGVILTSRGCPFCCSYCFHMWDRKVRYRSIDSVMAEIKQVHEKYKTTHFSIKDDSFTVNKKHVLDMCAEFRKLPFKLTFDCTTRVDILNDELLSAMMSAGLTKLSIGIESGSAEILKQTDKGITHEQILKCAKMLNKHKVFWTGYFMMGLPTETEDDILKTLAFLKKSNPYFGGLGVYSPFPRTKLFRQGLEMGLIEAEPPLEHFLTTNPKDLFFKDPKKRVVNISYERFEELTEIMENGFRKHNNNIFNLLRRAYSRRYIYKYDKSLLRRDIQKGLELIGLKKLAKIIKK